MAGRHRPCAPRQGSATPDEASVIAELLEMRADFLRRSGRAAPKGKERVTLRLDAEVVDWFRAGGEGCQARINAVLQAYMDWRRKR
jgi:uncharacterized protein (DUF4415 family)